MSTNPTDTWRGVVSDEESEVDEKESARLRKRSRNLLGSLLAPYKKHLVITSVFMLFNLGTWLVRPYLIGVFVIDRGIESGDPQKLIFNVGLLLIVATLEIIFWAGFLRVSGTMGQSVLYDLRVRLFDKFQKLSISFHEKFTSGRVVARLTSDVDALGELLRTGLHEVVTNVLAIIGILGFMLFLNAKLALVGIAAFIPVAFMTWWFRKHSERIYRKVREAVALVIVFYNESLGGIRAGQAFRREDRNKLIFSELTGRYKEANIESGILAAKFGPGIRLLGRYTGAAVLGVGAVLLFRDEPGFTLGVLVSFMGYVGRFFGPLQDLSQFYNVFQAASAALEKIAGALEEAPAVPEPQDPVVPDYIYGDVEFRNVTFAYDETPVIHEVSVHVPAGQTVALVGETGAGKSTLAKLIARFYDPTEGQIFLDGVDVRRLPEWRLRRAVAVVTQESFLFSGTVADNISFGKPDATREEVEHAARAIGAYEFISNLPEGFDTDVKKRGGRLSAGQRQLIAFARAFLADPSVLILDEATSSLDIPTERLVQHALRTLLADRTAFIIAHRLTTVEIADRVLVVDDGRIVEDGAPQDLISGSGAYGRLHAQWLESLAS